MSFNPYYTSIISKSLREFEIFDIFEVASILTLTLLKVSNPSLLFFIYVTRLLLDIFSI